MSLINDALKKAQAREAKTLDPATGMPRGPSVGPSPAATPPPYGMLIGLALGVAVVVGAGVAMIVYGLMKREAPAAQTQPLLSVQTPMAPTKAEQRALAPVALPTAPAVESAPAPAPVEAAGLPSASPPEAAPAPPAAPVIPVVAELPPEPPTAAEALESTPDIAAINEFITQLEIRGVLSGDKQRVLVFDPVRKRSQSFEVLAVVSRSLGLYISEITPHSITFADASGKTYVKYF